MHSLQTACRRLLPYMATAFGVVELDRVIDVEMYTNAVLLPLLVCVFMVAVLPMKFGRKS